MPLTTTRMIPGGHLQSVDIKQYADLLLGTMADQPVTVNNVLTIGGQQRFGTDNTYDIGGAAANRPRTIHVGTSLVSPMVNTPLLAPSSNLIEQRNGTNAQSFSVYMVYTDASNYTRLKIGPGAGGNAALIAEVAGTGQPHLFIGTQGGGAIIFQTLAADRWVMGPHLTAAVDNTLDIGASGATRPRSVFVGTSVVTPMLDTPLLAPTGNQIEQRNGTNAQTLRIYSSYVGASDYSRLVIQTGLGSGSQTAILTEASGTGTAQRLIIGTSTFEHLQFRVNSVDRWYIAAQWSGALVANTDNTVDIGQATQGRPKNIYQAGGTFQSYNPGAGIANDGTNYERARLEWAGNALYLGTQKAGTGAARIMILAADSHMYIRPGALGAGWFFHSGGNFLAETDNVFDIGGAAIQRPRTIYVGTSVVTPVADLSSYVQQVQIAKPANPAAGSMRLYPKADGKYYSLNSAGVETDLSAAAGGGVPDPLRLGNGTAPIPTYSFTSDTNTGVYLPGADCIGLVTNGANRLVATNTEIQITGHLWFTADNTYDIGASSTTQRPRNVYAANGVVTGGGGAPIYTTPNNFYVGLLGANLNDVRQGLVVVAGTNNGDQFAVRWVRRTAGTSWTETAMVLARDVDSTPNVSPYLAYFPSGLGINRLTASYANAALSINGTVGFEGSLSSSTNIIQIERGTSPQSLRIYNTYVGASDWERLRLDWAGNNAFVGPEASGTGTQRALIVQGATIVLKSGTVLTDRWSITGSGHLIASVDNAFDIGASGATRPRDLYMAGHLRMDQTGNMHATVGRVGIMGAIDAAYALKVTGNTLFTGDISFGSMTTSGSGTFGGPVQAQYFIGPLLRTNTAADLTLGTNSSERWKILATTGHFIAAADNTYDIGASGASRPRNLYMAGLSTFPDLGSNTPSIWNNGFSQLNARAKIGYGGSGADPICLISMGAANPPTAMMTQTNQYMVLSEYWGNSLATGTVKGWEVNILGSVSGTINVYSFHIKRIGRQSPGVVQNAKQLVLDATTTGSGEGGSNENVGIEIGDQQGASSINLSLWSKGPVRIDKNLTFGATAQRILGDFSNGAYANRAMFQTSTVNGSTEVGAIPNGTNTGAWFEAFSASDPTNSACLLVGLNVASARITSDKLGTGSYVPLLFYVGGAERLRIETTGEIRLAPGTGLVEQRNFTSPQILKIYNTYTDGSNYERMYMGYAGSNAFLAQEIAGTGVRRQLIMEGWQNIYLRTAGVVAGWRINGSQHMVCETDNVMDLGQSGATRPRNVYVSGAVATGVKAGVAVDADVTSPVDGMLRVDSTNNRLYVRVAGVWKYVALT